MAQDPKKLGDLLVDKKLISKEVLDDALKSQRSLGDRLGHILMVRQLVKPLELYRTLAEQMSCPFADLVKEPVDPTLVAYDELAYLLSHRCIPWKRPENGGIILACTDLSPRMKHWAEAYFSEKVYYAITTPRDLLYAIGQCFGPDIDYETRMKLLMLTPEFSAFHTLTRGQRFSLIFVLLAMTAALIIAPMPVILALVVGMNGFYIGSLLLKWVLYANRNLPTERPELPPHEEGDAPLPIYTILVPVYKERESIPRLLAAIDALDYPKTRLDVKLVVEEGDDDTIAAIKQADPQVYVEIVRVPYSMPQTKPKACNYALTFARGDYVTIYDAEDQPEPDQLRRAVAAFRSASPDVACLQARLNYYNWNENTLTRLFAIEYSCLFDFMLPGLQAIGIPIPLGGTSNHIALKRLRELGEWDPYNVTEDADLGMRLAIKGYRTQVLNSTTLEEAPVGLYAWIKQRSRWIKGYMQTWLVYMRSPVTLYRALGPSGFWGFQFFIGGACLVYLLAPFLWALCAVWVAGGLPDMELPEWLFSLCSATLGLGITSHLWFARAAIRRWKWQGFGMSVAMLLFPIYWLLHSLASFRALWQLIRRPHY